MRERKPVSLGAPVIGAMIVAATLALGGCSEEQRQSATNVLDALAQVEQIKFKYLLLAPDPAGDYTLSIDGGAGCTDYRFSQQALAELFRDRQIDVTRTIGGGPVTSTLQFTTEMLDPCGTPQTVQFDTPDLSIEVRDANGNVTGRARAELGIQNPDVRARLTAGGQMQVRLQTAGLNLVGQTVRGTREANQEITLSAAEISGNLVGRPGEEFRAGHALHPYSSAKLVALRSNPAGFTATFTLIAKTATGEDILLVWDGDLNLRTDL